MSLLVNCNLENLASPLNSLLSPLQFLVELGASISAFDHHRKTEAGGGASALLTCEIS